MTSRRVGTNESSDTTKERITKEGVGDRSEAGTWWGGVLMSWYITETNRSRKVDG